SAPMAWPEATGTSCACSGSPTDCRSANYRGAVGWWGPTPALGLRSMERAGLVRRIRSEDDRRKVRVFLSAKAKRLRNELIGVARGITDAAEAGITQRDLATFRRTIARMTANLDRIE